MIANDKNLSYIYNSDGIRTSKTVGNVTTNYFLDGSTIIAQKTNSDVLWFLYDSDGTRIGFTYNDASYYYTKNAQGDGTLFKEVGDFFGNLWNGYLSYRQSNDKAVEEMQIQFAINQANNEAAIAKRWVVF